MLKTLIPENTVRDARNRVSRSTVPDGVLEIPHPSWHEGEPVVRRTLFAWVKRTHGREYRVPERAI
jgi:hypothetical protein